ncbi:hypothetical protein SARC_17447, partial [Sphaeroforma arctica JP610]
LHQPAPTTREVRHRRGRGSDPAIPHRNRAHAEGNSRTHIRAKGYSTSSLYGLWSRAATACGALLVRTQLPS